MIEIKVTNPMQTPVRDCYEMHASACPGVSFLIKCALRIKLIDQDITCV